MSTTPLDSVPTDTLTEAGNELAACCQSLIMQLVQARGTNQMTPEMSEAFEAVRVWQVATGRIPDFSKENDV